MTSHMKRFIRLLRQPPRVWFLVCAALLLTGWYRWRLLHIPFSRLSGRIGTYYLETKLTHKDSPVIREVQYAVSGISRHTPWQSRCLVQALAAKRLLKLYHLPCTLYMGVKKDEQGKMLAHAWLRCGDCLVTGGAGHRLYTVTAIYGDTE